MYYARNIGYSSSPGGECDYEFLVTGRSTAPESQNRIIGTMLFHGAILAALESSIDRDDEEFTISICANLAESDCGPRTIASQIQKLKFVKSVEFRPLRGRMFGSLFPLTILDTQRVVALNSRTLLNLSARLARETGWAGANALFAEGRAYAGDAIREIKERLLLENSYPDDRALILESDADAGSSAAEAYCVKCRAAREVDDPRQVIMKNGTLAMAGSCAQCGTRVFRIGTKIFGKVRDTPLISNVQGFLIAAGWGTFQLRSEINGRTRTVTILDPPRLEGAESYSCNQFIEGIAAAFLEGISLTKNELAVTGEKYDSRRRIMTIQFAEVVPFASSLEKEVPYPKATGQDLPRPAVIEQLGEEEVTVQEEKAQQQEEEELTEEAEPAPSVQIEPIVAERTTSAEDEEVNRIIRSLEEIASEANDAVVERDAVRSEEPQSEAEQGQTPETAPEITVEDRN